MFRKYDYWWIIGILTLSLILVASARLADNITVLNYFSFAGILVSILLGVIAILYSFFQGQTANNLTKAASDIQNYISQLTATTDVLSELKSNLDLIPQYMDYRLTEHENKMV